MKPEPRPTTPSLGAVSANELTLALDNTGRVFTPTNQNGPYYGKLKPNVKLEPYLGLVLPDESIEWMPLGVYWSGDWLAPSQSLQATVTAYDRVYQIGQMDVPGLVIQPGTTIGQLFRLLFQRLGLVEGVDFAIDPTIQAPVAQGWLPNGKVLDAMQALCVAGTCNVTADRLGIIQVKNNFHQGNPVIRITDQDHIKTAENPQRWLQTYSSVRINYKIPTVKTGQTVLQLDSFTIPNGVIKFLSMQFSQGPVRSLTQIQLIGASNSTLVVNSWDAWTVTFTTTNTGPDEQAQIVAVGDCLQLNVLMYSQQDSEAVASFGVKELKVDSDFIQSLQAAQAYAAVLLAYVTDPSVQFELEVRGDPAMEVGDIIEIDNPTDLIGLQIISLYRIELDFDGALEAKISARKPVAPKTWVMVSPGLYELVYYDFRKEAG